MINHRDYNHRDAEVHCPCTSYAHGRQEKGPQHMVHCYALRSTMHTWPRPPKPEKRRDGTEWPENSWPMRLHRLNLTSSASRDAYWAWLLQNPLEFQKFCQTTRYFDRVCPSFGEVGEWCCIERRAEYVAADAYDSRDEEGEELEIVIPQAMLTTARRP